MKSMPNTEITEYDYQILRYAGCIADGGEAIICMSDRPDTLYKLFIGENEHLPGLMSDNKLRKILHQFNNPLEHSVAPLGTISFNGELIGYEMTYDKDDVIMSQNFSRKDLITYLAQAKKVLEYYASKDIIYGDIKNNNILINPKTYTVKFCDMDNIQLGEYPIDLVGYDLSCFILDHGGLDETADAYMHNLLTLEQIAFPDKSFQSILYSLAAKKYPKHFHKTAKRIMDSMVRAENFQGEYIIQYVKK